MGAETRRNGRHYKSFWRVEKSEGSTLFRWSNDCLCEKEGGRICRNMEAVSERATRSSQDAYARETTLLLGQSVGRELQWKRVILKRIEGHSRQTGILRKMSRLSWQFCWSAFSSPHRPFAVSINRWRLEYQRNGFPFLSIRLVCLIPD